MQIHTNHIGYSIKSPKKAVIKTTVDTPLKPVKFEVIDKNDGAVVLSGVSENSGTVDKWKNWQFQTIDFSEVNKKGKYFIKAEGEISHDFEIKDKPVEETISDIIYYFKSQRCADRWDKKDKNLPVFNEDRTVDVHGGWYDASGDVSKYLSHLSYANFMNPQHIQMVIWGMFKASADLNKKNTEQFFGTEKIASRLFDEAMYGSDFLVRMQDPCGAFYMTVFDQWTADIDNRMICEYVGQDGRRFDTWQCAYRQGGGVSIAALAVAAATGQSRDYDSKKYLETAIKGFDHLEENNLKYCNDGKENIIDDYCALMAATELYTAAKEQRFMDAAAKRAKNIISRISSDENYSNFLFADNEGKRTFFHGADAGLPVVALLNFEKISDNTELNKEILDAVKKIMTFELEITKEVTNPFGYPRQYVTDAERNKRGSFFIAQKNETGYWWQGENARLGSLATAARYTARKFDGEFAEQLETYAENCINWLLGLNPYDTCMLQGRGHNNVVYEEGYPSAPGGMCNGITAGFVDEHDIDLNPEEPKVATTGDHRWRWGEQWIPHSGWYILAVSAENN